MSEPPMLRRRGIGRSGRLSEQRLAKQLGGRQRPASGAMAGAKGDVDLPAVLLEAKSTVRAQLALKHSWLAKIAAEARAVGKQPALSLSFTTGDGRPVLDGEWVCLPLHLWRELVEP